VNTELDTIINTTTSGLNIPENTASSELRLSENTISIPRQNNNSFVNTTSNTWDISQATPIRKITTKAIIQENLSANFTAIPKLEELFPDQNATLPRSTKYGKFYPQKGVQRTVFYGAFRRYIFIKKF
jgi:hypothetical protein